jgi:hypothetical protein
MKCAVAAVSRTDEALAFRRDSYRGRRAEMLRLIGIPVSEAALGLGPSEWQTWVREQKKRVIHNICGACSIAKSAIAEGFKCWMVLCPLRVEPVSEAELDRHAAELAKAAGCLSGGMENHVLGSGNRQVHRQKQAA